jgi:hypothetical protein
VTGYSSVSGFGSRMAAVEYLQDMHTEQRRGTWLDPAGAKLRLAEWVDRWIDTIDVETRTEENYRRCLRLHVLPRWSDTKLGEITSSAVAEWLKRLRERYAASTVVTLRTILSMILDDAVDERLIPANPDRAGVGDARAGAAHRRASHPARWPIGRAAGDHHRVDRLPLGRDRRPPTRPGRPRPRNDHH